MAENTYLEREIRNHLFSEQDLVLLQMLCARSFVPEQTWVLTEELDVDNENTLYLLLLGIAGYRRHWQGIPEELIPRLKGIHRYYQVRNSAAAPWFQNQLSILEDQGIPVMLTGGSAIRAVYVSDTPRMMYGYDITVPSSAYEKAVELLRGALKNADPENAGTRTIQGISFLKIHEGVPDKRLFSEEDLWKRAHSVEYLKHTVLIQDPEAALLQLFCIPYGPWAVTENHPDRVRRMAETCRITERKIDYPYLSGLAKKAGVQDAVRFYLNLLSSAVPDIVSKSDWADCFPADRFWQTYLSEMQKVCRIDEGPDNRIKRLKLRLAEQRLRMHIKNTKEQL